MGAKLQGLGEDTQAGRPSCEPGSAVSVDIDGGAGASDLQTVYGSYACRLGDGTKPDRSRRDIGL